MSQIAQQDHLYIEVADPDIPTEGDNAAIVSAWKRGVLDDVIIVMPGGHAKVVAWYVDIPDLPTNLYVHFSEYGGAGIHEWVIPL